MPLTVGWNGGVLVGNENARVVFDPRRNNHLHCKCFITHAHQDHSRGFRFGDSEKISTRETKEIVKAYGRKIDRWEPLPIGQKTKISDLEVVSHNAGHVLGSALYEVITPEGNVVYTGDLQCKDSLTLKGAEPVPCDILVIESTFGSESFRFPERNIVAQEMVRWALRTIKNGKIPTFKADSLGNAQEVIKVFNLFSELPVIVHWRIAQISEIYRADGQSLRFLDARAEADTATKIASSGECVFITPKNVNLKNHPELEPALVSGWALWTRKNAFALSDHADFSQLMEFVEACKPKVVLTCLGRFKEEFAKKIEKRLGIEARPLDLIPTKFAQ